MYTSMKSTTGSMFQSMTESEREHSPTPPDSNPVQVAVITGRQEIKLKTKQNDTLVGPKV